MKNGGVGGGAWCEIELQEEAGEELVKVGWTHGPNGMEKSKTAIDLGGLCEDTFGGFY